MSKDSTLVFSCDESGFSSINENKIKEINNPANSVLSVWLERRGRNGKEVTIINNIPGNKNDWRILVRKLKNILATGGSVKNNSLVLQGDHVCEASKILKDIGYSILRSGG